MPRQLGSLVSSASWRAATAAAPAAVSATVSIPAAAGTGSTPAAVVSAVSPAVALARPPRRRRRWWWLRQRWHARRVDHHVAVRSSAGTLAAEIGRVAKRQVNDPALSARHWVEAEGIPSLPDLLGYRQRADAKLFLPQQPVVVGVEAEESVFVALHLQQFLRQLLKSE